MASPQVNMRWPASLISRVDAQAARQGVSRTDYVLEAVEAMVRGDEDQQETDERRQAPKPKAAPKSIQHPAPEDKAAAARAALRAAESRTGVVPARLDTSMVPVMARGKRPAYQRGGKR